MYHLLNENTGNGGVRYVAPSSRTISLQESSNVMSPANGNGGTLIDYDWEEEEEDFSL